MADNQKNDGQNPVPTGDQEWRENRDKYEYKGPATEGLLSPGDYALLQSKFGAPAGAEAPKAPEQETAIILRPKHELAAPAQEPAPAAETGIIVRPKNELAATAEAGELAVAAAEADPELVNVRRILPDEPSRDEDDIIDAEFRVIGVTDGDAPELPPTEMIKALLPAAPQDGTDPEEEPATAAPATLPEEPAAEAGNDGTPPPAPPSAPAAPPSEHDDDETYAAKKAQSRFMNGMGRHYAAVDEKWGLTEIDDHLASLLKQVKKDHFHDGAIKFKVNEGHTIRWTPNFGGTGTEFIGRVPGALGFNMRKMNEHDAEAIVALGKAKGWKTLKVYGKERDKEMLWLEAQRQGMEVTNYEPSPDSAVYKKYLKEKEIKTAGIMSDNQTPTPSSLNTTTPGITDGTEPGEQKAPATVAAAPQPESVDANKSMRDWLQEMVAYAPEQRPDIADGLKRTIEYIDAGKLSFTPAEADEIQRKNSYNTLVERVTQKSGGEIMMKPIAAEETAQQAVKAAQDAAAEQTTAKTRKPASPAPTA